MFERSRALLAVIGLALASCGGEGYQLTIRNETGGTLFHAPVITDPPPPQRILSTTTVATGFRYEIATDDFNPVFFHKPSQLGIHVQFDWASDPPPVLVRIYQHVVAPGAEGNDPALQPTKLSETYYEVDNKSDKKNVQINAGLIADGIPITIEQF